MKNLDILDKLGDFFVKHQDKEMLDETVESYWYTVFSLYLQLFQVHLNMSPYFVGVGWVEDQVCFGTSDSYPDTNLPTSYEIQFQEVDQTFTCSDPSFDLNDSLFSNVFLINIDELPALSETTIIISKGSPSFLGNSTYLVTLYTDASGQSYIVIIGIGATWWYIPVNLTTNTWYNMAICANGTNRYFYLNSILLAQGAYTPTGVAKTGGIFFGYGAPYFGKYKIDEIRFYDTCLTQARVTTYYNFGAGKYGSTESDLQAGYHFNEGSGIVTADYSGNDNDLTWEMTPVFAFNYADTSRMARMQTLALEENTDYDFIVRAGIKDIYGNSLASDYISTFKTKNTSIFKVDEVYPISNAIDVDPRDRIFVKFNNGTTNAIIKLYKAGVEVPVSGSGTSVNGLCTFIPDDMLDRSTSYEVIAHKESVDVYGNTLPIDYRWFFTTLATGAVTLTWTASAGADYYGIYRSLTSGSGYSKLDNAMSNIYIDESGVIGVTYYYKVTAINSGGESGYSNEVSGTRS
jgi:hypothetical protein